VAAKASATEQITPTRKLQLEFWTEFEKKLKQTKELPSTQTPRPQYWFNVALGRSGVHLSCIADTSEKRIGVRVYFRGYLADRALEELMPQREAIEKQIGAALTWNPHPEKSDKIILLDRVADISQREKWPEYLNWLVDHTLRFRRAFAARLKGLELPSGA
jgi:hypothetical protein